MQVRKLIRLLSEMVEKDPSAAYLEACVDNQFGANFVDDYRYSPIGDVMAQNCVWENDNPDTEVQRDVIVLGNY